MEIFDTAAIVTGGASGLGEATARRLAAAGAHVTIADLNEEAGNAIAADLGPRATFARVDVADVDAVQAFIAVAAQRAPLRIAVSCAGIAPGERTVSRDGSPHRPSVFRAAIDVNLIGTFNVMTHAAAVIANTEPLDSGERGVIVNTASIAAYEGQIGQLAYAATKGAIVAMTLPAARDLAQLGIRVCAIAPGTFETPLLAKLPESARVDLAATIPFPKRLGRPAEFAELVHSIVTIPTLNGEVIRLDGALRMQPR